MDYKKNEEKEIIYKRKKKNIDVRWKEQQMKKHRSWNFIQELNNGDTVIGLHETVTIFISKVLKRFFFYFTFSDAYKI